MVDRREHLGHVGLLVGHVGRVVAEVAPASQLANGRFPANSPVDRVGEKMLDR
jgi:hypothetical protein